jgi:hypothetical protein
MLPASGREVLTRFTGALLAVVVLVSAALAPAAALCCQVECCAPAGNTHQERACCPGHEAPAPTPDPAPGLPHDYDAGCCAIACNGCAARPLFVTAATPPADDLPPLTLAVADTCAAPDALDLPFSIFHPPRA